MLGWHVVPSLFWPCNFVHNSDIGVASTKTSAVSPLTCCVNARFIEPIKGSKPVQDMMLKVGVLGYLVPLLFGFDPTHGSESDVPSTDTSAVASLTAASEEAADQRDSGPAYLGLGTSRSNMQARCDFSSQNG